MISIILDCILMFTKPARTIHHLLIFRGNRSAKCPMLAVIADTDPLAKAETLRERLIKIGAR
jgi:hypothetical protein